MTRANTLIKEAVADADDGKVLMLLSGGVDSTVCTALLHKALGPDRAIAVHIDNVFMRKKESASECGGQPGSGGAQGDSDQCQHGVYV